MHKTFLSLFAVLCGMLMMSCGDDEIINRLTPRLVEFDIQGLSNYTINERDAIITCYIPKEGGDFVFEGVGEAAKSFNFTKVEMPGKGNYRVVYTFDRVLADECYDFYGGWASISYESLSPYKFRVHVDQNDSGYERSFNMEFQALYFTYSSIHFVQSGE